MQLPPQIGPYEVLAEVWRDECGVFYRALDERSGHEALVELFGFGVPGGSPALERFRTDAVAIPKLEHRNIARVLAVGEHGGRAFTATETVRGTTVASLLRQGSVGVVEALAGIEQACAAIHHAHAHQVLHLTLGPSCIWMSDGIAMVLGFGAGAVIGHASPDHPQGRRHAAPEIGRSQAIDARADVFSLGAILRDLITAPSGAIRTDVPPDLVAVVEKATSSDADRRYPTAAALAAALAVVRLTLSAAPFDGETMLERAPDWDEIRPVTPDVAPVRRRRRHPLQLPGLAVAVASAALAYALWPASGPAQPLALRVTTSPPGARVLLDGTPMDAVTPTTLTLSRPIAARLDIARDGFETVSVRLAPDLLARGEVHVELKPEAPPPDEPVPPTPPPPPPPIASTVRVSGSYPFEVYNSAGRLKSAAAQNHTISYTPGEQLTLRAEEHALNQVVRVSGSSIVAPGLGYLSVRTRSYERCRIRIDGVMKFGYPPLAAKPLAAGSHLVELACSGGRVPRGQSVTIAPGVTTMLKFP